MDENKEILEEVYPYQVNTRMPIVGLTIGILKVPATVKLTKEDVIICMKKAPVFRRYSNGIKERVSISNIDRLHREDFISEEDYNKMIDKENDHRGEVREVEKETPVVVEEKIEEVAPIVEPETVEEPNEGIEVPVGEEATLEVSEEEINKIEDVSEEVTENNEASKEEEKSYNNNTNRYNNKKKHNR